MKVLLFFALLLTLSCTREVSPASRLIGVWRLTSYCRSSSGAACTSVTIPTDKGVFVAFDPDGRFSESYQNTLPADFAFLGCGNGSYEVEGNDVRIKAPCQSSLTGQVVTLVSADSRRLVLRPGNAGDYIFARQ